MHTDLGGFRRIGWIRNEDFETHPKPILIVLISWEKFHYRYLKS